MKSNSVLIVGCGDLGQRTGLMLVDRGWTVTALRRNAGRLPAQFDPRSADYTREGSLDFAAQLRPDLVLLTCNPFDRSLAGYRSGFEGGMANLLKGLGSHRPRLVLMASSTRVYAESDGGWVDEDSPLSTSDPYAGAIIAAERQLLDSGHAAAVVRFGGIYGIPGGRLLSRIRRGELCPPEPVSYTNRMHREDCSGFLAHLLLAAANGESLRAVYNGVDDDPAPRFEVESWLAGRMDVDMPGSAVAALPPTQHNRSGHKRCRNRALHESGYRLRYPDYRSGYAALLQG